MKVPRMTNPLLSSPADLPRFDAIKPEHVYPAIGELLQQAEAALNQAVSPQVPLDFDALSAALDVPIESLGRAWGAVSHLHAVLDSPELRAAYTENLPRITDFYTRLGSDERLYDKYKNLHHNSGLSATRQRVLANAVRDFVLGGAELRGKERERFAQIQDELSALSQTFSEHVLDATDGFALYARADQLEGVPADILASTREAAQAQGREGHKLTLHAPCYRPVMQHSRDRALRQTLYTAYVTRASELERASGASEEKPARDNASVICQMLTLRQEEAVLLGHSNYAEVSLVPKMAQSPQQVLDFLRELSTHARPSAERDWAQLQAFAREHLALDELEAWDVLFASERLKEAHYAFSDQDVRNYFTEARVLQGVMAVIERLFDVQISPDAAPVWHSTVRFYRIERAGTLLGQFYLDPYARPGKRPGAWMDDVRTRWRRPGGALQTPVAHLVCNFAMPASGQQALLTHDDVITLFHEFGHVLHHLLTQVEDIGVSGCSGVEWDAVELPSQFMENFCWDFGVLQQLTGHVQTGAPLPRELFDRMLAAKNFHSGLHMLRQLEFALIDMRLHAEPLDSTPKPFQNNLTLSSVGLTRTDASGGTDLATQVALTVAEVRKEVALLPIPAFDRSLNSFSHIFAGGYSAGYYGYQWAEVLSADAFSALEESPGADVLNPQTGRLYCQNVLETGGSRTALENFKAFRGREPRMEALLRHQGLVA
jgi:oligopeptidase A